MGNKNFKWKGKQAGEAFLREVVEPGMGLIGLAVEGESKKELRKGHGVESGTLRRSIHTALPGYTWASDDVEPAPGTPERGKKRVNGLVVSVGSGLNYALPVHQGHGSFAGYHYILNGAEKVRGKMALDLLMKAAKGG